MPTEAGEQGMPAGWRPGRVAVTPDGSVGLGGYTAVADPSFGVVFAPDGGLFGHPGVAGWVAFRSGEVVQTWFEPGVRADPAQPPPRASTPVAPVLPPQPRPVAPAAALPPAAADRVRIKDRTHAVAVSQHANGWLVKGAVDGRMFKATGHSEVLALAAWRSLVIRELDL